MDRVLVAAIAGRHSESYPQTDYRVAHSVVEGQPAHGRVVAAVAVTTVGVAAFIIAAPADHP